MDAAERELLALSDQVNALQADVRALAAALSSDAQALQDFVASQEERAAAVARELEALRAELRPLASVSGRAAGELSGVVRELRGLYADLRAEPDASPAAEPEPSELEATPAKPVIDVAVAPAPAAAPPSPVAAAAVSAAEKPRRSFLAFQLPSSDFRFDERRSWSVLPALSRVGFDAKTTLHDFSGTTSEVAGELTADLAHPEREPRLVLRVEAAALATGDEARDEKMRAHLAVGEHPALEFELTRFDPLAVDERARTLSGTAFGRMRIRGVEREASMAVRLSLDQAQRLCVEGAMTLDLEHFGVPVPNKLGLITMEKEVEIWISLRLRVNARADGGP